PARDQPVARVARCRDAVVHGAAALTHQRHHLVRGVAVRHVHLASGFVLERRDPVEVLASLARPVLDVAGPCDQLERTLRLADRVVGLRRLDRAAGLAARGVVVAPTRRRHYGERREHDEPRSHHLVHAASSPGSSDPSSESPAASTGRLFLRSHTRRTTLPRTWSAPIEDVARFCWITTSSPPTSSVTMYRVNAPRYTTSRT